MIVKRLHETDAEAVSAFMRGDIQPASIEGSSWVCQARQRPHYWGKETLERMSEADKSGKKTMIWVALEDKPIGLCWIGNQTEDRFLGMFLVDVNASKERQWEIADTIALRSLSDMLADDYGKRNVYGWFPKYGWAADYATRCGFTSTQSGKQMAPNPNPLLHWTIDMRQLQKNIEELDGKRDSR